MDCNKANIKNGNTGNDVKELQKYLKYYGYYTGNIDGQCGTLTVNAIKTYQRTKKLVVDGIWGTISCRTSNINGTDISLTNGTIGLNKWQDMINRYNNYLQNNNQEPQIIYLDKENPYEYITLNKYKEIKTRYDNYIQEHNNKPNYMYINKTTITTTTTTETKTTTTTTTTNTNKTVYTNNKLCEKSGGNCLGQITGYHCGPHSIIQALRKLGISGWTEKTVGGYAGTTTAGTGHSGLETAIAKIAKVEGINLKVEWKNFSDFGSNKTERFKALGKLIDDPNKTFFWHEMYRNQYGHYSLPKTINLNNSNLIIPNSLGSKCSSPAYCGYIETRSMNTQTSYFSGISQKSICIITKS